MYQSAPELVARKITDARQARRSGITTEDNRRFINAVFWLATTAAPCHDLPERFGKWNSVFQRYSRWCATGVWWEIVEALGGDEDLEELVLDSSIVRAHLHEAGKKEAV